MATLSPLQGLVILDEVQRRPELFPVLRVLADRIPLTSRFLVLGSASPELLRQASESLAGRIEVVELSGFSLAEVGVDAREALWLCGGLPQDQVFELEEKVPIERNLPALGVLDERVDLDCHVLLAFVRSERVVRGDEVLEIGLRVFRRLALLKSLHPSIEFPLAICLGGNPPCAPPLASHSPS
jgi:AAA domain-containing protein